MNITVHNIPNKLTFCRIVMIPIFVVSYYLPYSRANVLTTFFFVLAAVTDWLDGYIARRFDQSSLFGAFLDPVADKLMIASALVLLLSDIRFQSHLISNHFFTLVALIIIGREITISALREWMAEVGKRSSVAVSYMSKFKTIAQMTAIALLLFREPFLGIPIITVGEILLYLAAVLTLWSMIDYLKAAWQDLVNASQIL